MVRSVALRTFVVLSSLSLAACGASDSAVGGGAGGGKGAGVDAGSTGGGAGGGGGANACSGFIELCNGADDDCDGMIDEGFDNDNDGVSSCADDCNDDPAAGGATIHPGATE